MPLQLPSIKIPSNDAPLVKDGQFAQSWSAHLEDVTDRVNNIGVGNIKGTNAGAGRVGEILTAGSASSVALVSGITVNVAVLNLTPGDWDVSGMIAFHPQPTTSFRSAGASVSQTSNTFAGLTSPAAAIIAYSAQVPAIDFGFPVGLLQINSATAKTVYLTAFSAFTVSTCSAYGSLRARRMS